MSVLPRFASSNIAASVPTVYLGSGFSSSKISAIFLATSTGSVPNCAIIFMPETTLSVILPYGEFSPGFATFNESKNFVFVTPGSTVTTFTPNCPSSYLRHSPSPSSANLELTYAGDPGNPIFPSMRARGFGHIVNVSSIAGKIGFPGSPAYVSSKFALEGLGECLRYELGQFGVNVVTVEPGVTKTKFFDSLKVAKPGENSPYGKITDKVVSGIKMMAQFGTEPVEVAKKIADILEDENPLPRYTVGTDAAMFDEAKRGKTDIEFENYVKSQLFT